MKKTILFIICVICIFSAGKASAQTYFNYALAYLDSAQSDSHSLIRAIDDTSALVYYYDYAADCGVIARIGLTLSCRKALLPRHCTVNDMRITGNNVYFCGHCDTNAVIGHIYLNDFSSSNRNVTLYKAKSAYVTNLHRLVAYNDGAQQKVVAVGDVIFTEHSDPEFQCPFDTSYYDPELGDTVHYYYYTCIHTVVLEVLFNGASYSADKYTFTTKIPSRLQLVTDVVETPNHVAIVGHYTNHHTTILFRCNKSDVMNSLSPHWCYWGIDEGNSVFHCCQMGGDTIAVSSLSVYRDDLGNEQFSTNIRVFDLVSMQNTHALRVPLKTKTEPYDLMYMPKCHQLVLLQNINLPSYGEQCAFLHIDPYDASSSTTFSAKCWFESTNKPFYSLSRLNDSIYVSAGGKYWCMKDIDPLAAGACYKTDAVEITRIKTEKPAKEGDSYRPDSVLTFLRRDSSFENVLMTPDPCIVH